MHRLAAEGGDPASIRILLVLLGAIATLIAGAVLQVWVVPRVQARTRRLERWEDDLNELDNLLQDQLKRAMNRFRGAANSERHMQEILEQEDLTGPQVQRAQEFLAKGRGGALGGEGRH